MIDGGANVLPAIWVGLRFAGVHRRRNRVRADLLCLVPVAGGFVAAIAVVRFLVE